MKKITILLLITTVLIISKKVTAQTNSFPNTGSAGIGTTTPNASALLEIKSTTKGFLISRMTKIQRDAIATPATGLMIYQTNSAPGFYYYDGSKWVAVSPKGANQSLSNLTAPTGVNVDLLPGTPGSFNLGAAASSWKNIYFNGSLFYGSHRALLLDTVNENTAVGESALYSNTTGFDNTANGNQTLYFNTTGHNNTANGSQALYSNTTGNVNTAYGFAALYSNTIGYGNTAYGDHSLFSNTAGNSNTALGYFTNVASGNLSNAMALGYFATVNASNKVVVGNSSVTVIGGQVGWSIFSDGRFKTNVKQNVPGLLFINKLKPVTYTLELKKFDRFLGRADSVINSMQADYAIGEKKIRTGFIAQEVERVAKEINYDFDGVNPPQNDKDNYSIAYADFVPSLVKAVQELSKMNDDKDARINDLQKQVDELKTMIVSSRSTVNSQRSTDISAASLQQNIPNPFTHSTTINYTLPQSYSSAKIIVVDNSGNILKEANLTGSGKGNLKLDVPTLASGAYNYSLYVNGKLIDTKQMVTAK